ncbi:MAG: enoyl-CoA hydratase-related protein [Kineosporiaceae bacterium]
MRDHTTCTACGEAARVERHATLDAAISRPGPRSAGAGPEAAADSRRMRILLLCSAFNGLSQRAWVELREAGHQVEVQLATDADAVRAAVRAVDPDLVICPFLRERVPAEVWNARPTIVLHPGPKGDRGPSSLDWALMDAAPVWGVTAVEAVEEMDAGPIWGSRTFPLGGSSRKSDLYNTAVTDAAVELVHEVVARAADPSFVPEPLDHRRADVIGRLRPSVRQADRAFCWSDRSELILRRIRAADGSPGVRSELAGLPVAVFDAHASGSTGSPGQEPGAVTGRRHGAVQVATGDGAIWVGHLRSLADSTDPGLKLPATTVLDGLLHDVPTAADDAGYREIAYRRDGAVGVLTFDFYNGAMSTRQCRRLDAALQHATDQDTRVLLLQGGTTFSNGIHLGVIEAATDPAAEAWDNIVAIDDVCRRIITCTRQLVVCSVAGNAGAGGVMLALGADHVLLRHGVVLNPHYQSMGLYGSEYWTYVLPRRVGPDEAAALTTRCDPIGSQHALRTGLADEVLHAVDVENAAARYAARLAGSTDYLTRLADKRTARIADEWQRPLRDYRHAELDRMWSDIVDDEHGFAEARRAFILTRRVPRTTAATT